MAKVLKTIFTTGSDEIVQGFSINSWHVSQSVEALTGASAYDITISGSLEIEGPLTITGSIKAVSSGLGTYNSTNNLLFIDQTTGEVTLGGKLDQITVLSASYAVSASYALNAQQYSASFSSSISELSSSLSSSISSLSSSLSSSISDLSGSTNALSSSLSIRLTDDESKIASLEGISGSLYTSSSISNDTITFNQVDGTTESVTINNTVTSSYALTASYSELTQILNANQNVGGISSGDSFTQGSSIEALLRSMLIAYIEPVISSLVIRLDGSSISTATRDVGNSFTCNTSSFSATLDSPNGNYPTGASITASGADIGTQQIFLSNTIVGSNAFGLGSTLTIVRASSAGSVSFTVNTKSQTTVDTQSTSTSFAFYWRNYLGASSTSVVDNTTAQAVVTSGTVASTLTTGKSWTATCTSANANGSNYTFITYPASYGDLSNVIQNGSLPVLTAFTKKGDFTVANSFGSSNSFRVYQSNQPGAFSAGTTLTIS